jgi:sugar phosphate isomerase/epimerase
MIDAALELGCRRIVATGAKRGQAGGLESIIAVLEQIVPYAEETGVLICLENHANNNLETIADYERIFQTIDSRNVGVCIDTGHFDASGIELGEVVRALHPKVNHIHVKEAASKGVETFVRFGEGVTDNDAVIRTMIAKGYSGYISVELGITDKSNVVHDVTVPYEMFKTYER